MEVNIKTCMAKFCLFKAVSSLLLVLVQRISLSKNDV